MAKTTLVIMAAGIGSRFGQGIKQLTSFGPAGEIIIDYSIYDAIRAGFDQVVFVIRKDLEKDFRAIIGDRIARQIPVKYAFQEKDNLPAGFAPVEGRAKPWGTGQAILSCRGIVQEPFAVINADDYYGRDAFEKIHGWLSQTTLADGGKMHAAMVGFALQNTLSENGGVTRGVCSVGQNGELEGIVETGGIVKTAEGAAAPGPDGALAAMDPECLVSMNCWGFGPEFLDRLEEGFKRFLQGLSGDSLLKGEYLLPEIVDELMHKNEMDVSVLPSADRWFGVTYKEDAPVVEASIRDLIRKGVYPEKLWES